MIIGLLVRSPKRAHQRRHGRNEAASVGDLEKDCGWGAFFASPVTLEGLDETVRHDQCWQREGNERRKFVPTI